MTVRPPAVAGSFYPQRPDALRAAVEGFLAEAQAWPAERSPKAVIAPHAGYLYWGPVAGRAFAALRAAAAQVRRVVVIGPGACRAGPRAPLGDLPLDGAALEAMAGLPQVQRLRCGAAARRRDRHGDRSPRPGHRAGRRLWPPADRGPADRGKRQRSRSAAAGSAQLGRYRRAPRPRRPLWRLRVSGDRSPGRRRMITCTSPGQPPTATSPHKRARPPQASRDTYRPGRGTSYPVDLPTAAEACSVETDAERGRTCPTCTYFPQPAAPAIDR
jgi:hypothetical protein